jgi:hypothetical protein
MTFETFKRAFGAAVLAAALSGAAGCDNLADIIKDSLDDRGSPGDSAGAAPICREEKRPDGRLCKACYDAKGVLVGGDCASPDSMRECKETTLEGGTVCNICTDAAGVVTRDCNVPTAKCLPETGADGVECKVCYDATGKEVSRSCAGGGAITCHDEMLPDGVLCQICTDSAGHATRRCQGPAPTPTTPPPPLTCKEERLAPEVVCTVCYDASGAGVTRDCNPAR